MTRPLHILLWVCIVPALGGWAMAWVGAAHREREAAAQERLADQAAVERLAKDFGRLIREADEVEMVFSEPSRETKVKFRDPAWIARFSGIVGAATYTRTEFGLWTSRPVIILYRNGAEIGEVMMLGKVLRILGAGNGGDFIVGREVVSEILALTHEKETSPAETEVGAIRE